MEILDADNWGIRPPSLSVYTTPGNSCDVGHIAGWPISPGQG